MEKQIATEEGPARRKRWRTPDLSRIPEKTIASSLLSALMIGAILLVLLQLNTIQQILLVVSLIALALSAYLIWGTDEGRKKNANLLRVSRWIFILGFAALEGFVLSLVLVSPLSWHIPLVLAAIGLLALTIEATDSERRWGFITTCALATLILVALATTFA